MEKNKEIDSAYDAFAKLLDKYPDHGFIGGMKITFSGSIEVGSLRGSYICYFNHFEKDKKIAKKKIKITFKSNNK